MRQSSRTDSVQDRAAWSFSCWHCSSRSSHCSQSSRDPLKSVSPKRFRTAHCASPIGITYRRPVFSESMRTLQRSPTPQCADCGLPGTPRARRDQRCVSASRADFRNKNAAPPAIANRTAEFGSGTRYTVRVARTGCCLCSASEVAAVLAMERSDVTCTGETSQTMSPAAVTPRNAIATVIGAESRTRKPPRSRTSKEAVSTSGGVSRSCTKAGGHARRFLYTNVKIRITPMRSKPVLDS